jgi:hypothetical protein
VREGHRDRNADGPLTTPASQRTSFAELDMCRHFDQLSDHAM